MEQENYLMKQPNQQGYRILDGNSVHYCDDPDVTFEWALIDRGEGKQFCVGHWVKFDDMGWEHLENIQWAHGHYFDTLEQAEYYYREQVIRELHYEIEEMKERLKEEYKRKAELPRPEEEEE